MNLDYEQKLERLHTLLSQNNEPTWAKGVETALVQFREGKEQASYETMLQIVYGGMGSIQDDMCLTGAPDAEYQEALGICNRLQFYCKKNRSLFRALIGKYTFIEVLFKSLFYAFVLLLILATVWRFITGSPAAI